MHKMAVRCHAICIFSDMLILYKNGYSYVVVYKMLILVFILSTIALVTSDQVDAERHLVGVSVTLSCTGKVYPG